MRGVLSGLDLRYFSIKANASDDDGLRIVSSKITLEKHNRFYDNSLPSFFTLQSLLVLDKFDRM